MTGVLKFSPATKYYRWHFEKPKPDYNEALTAKEYTESPREESSSRVILDSKLLVAF